MDESQDEQQRPLRTLLTRGAAASLLGRLLLTVAILLVSTFATRLLSPAEAGGFFLALAIAQAGAVAASVGVGRAGTRVIAQSMAVGETGRAGAAIRVTARWGALATVGAVILLSIPQSRGLMSAAFPGAGLDRVAPIIGLTIGFRAFGLLRADIFRGFHAIGRATISEGLDAFVITAVGLGSLVLVTSTTELEYVLLVHAASWAPGLLVGWLALTRRARPLDGPGTVNQGDLLSMAWPMGVHALSGVFMSYADLWVVGAATTAGEAAAYGAALRVAALIPLALHVLNGVLPPIVAELAGTRRTDRLQVALRTSASLAMVPALGLAAVMVLAGSPLLALLFGSHYRAGGTVLAVLALGQLANVGFGPCQYALMMAGHERPLMIISSASAALMTIGAVGVVGIWGIEGVAVVASLGLLLQNVTAWLALRKLGAVWSHAGLRTLFTVLTQLRQQALQLLTRP